MIQWKAPMITFFDVSRYLGTFRWIVSKGLFVFGEDLAEILGFDAMQARRGVELALLADVIHPHDHAAFFAATERASYYGGDLTVELRLLNSNRVEHIRLTGSCVRASRGRPAEFLGALHAWIDEDAPPLAIVADHLCAAAEIARGLNEQPLQRFVDMALFELGTRLAEAESEARKALTNLAIVR